jgi:O-antigen ligase
MDAPAPKRNPRHAVPVWARVISLLTLLVTIALLSLTGLHWGGHYEPVAIYAFWSIPLLWGLLALGLALAAARRYVILDFIDLTVLLFVGYAYYSYQWTPAGYEARFEMLWILTYAGVFLGMRHLLHSREWMIYLLLGLVIITVVNVGYALWCRHDPTPLIWGLERPNYGARVSGLFGCPNHFANLCIMGTLACIFLGTYSRFPWPLRIVLFYLAGIASVGIFLSVSRGGYLGWLAGMGVVTIYAFRTVQVKWWWKALLVALLAAGVLLVVLRNDFVMSRWDAFEEGKNVRFQLVLDAIRIWQNSPIWGTGMASFDDYHLRLPFQVQHRAVYAHNDYVNTLSDYGIVGSAIVLAFLLAVAWFLFRGRSAVNERLILSRRLGWAALAAMAVHEVVDFNLHLPACALAFFAILGLATSRTYREREPGTFLRALPGWGAVVVAVVVVVIGTDKAARTIRGIEVLNVPAEELRAQDIEAILAQGNEGFSIDPAASSYLVRYGDVLRVRAAEFRKPVPGETAAQRLERMRQLERIGRQSILFYDRALKASPMNDTLLIKKGLILDAMGHEQAAYLHYQGALEARPKSRFFHQCMAYHLWKRGYAEEARQHLEVAVSLHPGTSREEPFLQQANTNLKNLKKAMRPTKPSNR